MTVFVGPFSEKSRAMLGPWKALGLRAVVCMEKTSDCEVEQVGSELAFTSLTSAMSDPQSPADL